MNSGHILLYVFAISLLLFNPVFAQEDFVTSDEVVAFDGYDLITYFDNNPLQGHRKITYGYQGLNLRFVSEDNKQKFIENPEKYLPAYGGWCAAALVHGKKVVPNFRLFKIQNERLLFFEIKAFFNGATHWEKNPEHNEILADAVYHKMTVQ